MDTEYILDCSFEYAETTPLELAVLSSPRGAYWTVRNLVDADQAMPTHFLQNTARQRLDELTREEQYYFALNALPSMGMGMKLFAERAAYLVQCRVQQDLGVQGAARGLFLERDLGPTAGMVQRESDVTEGLVRLMLERMCGSLAQRWSQDLGLLAQAGDWYQADHGRSFEAMLRVSDLSEPHTLAPNLDVMQLAQQARLSRSKREKAQARERMSLAKAAIKKATKLFQGLGQERNLQLLVSGHEVTLSHPDSPFKYVLRPPEVSGWLVDRTTTGRTHTPYEIQLLTKDDVYLARLCVYFNNTPVLDQLLAMTLFITAGEEHLVLEKANFFGMTDWTPEKSERVLSVYPQLADKLPKKREGPNAPGLIRDIVHDAFEAERAHWEPYRGRVEQWIATWMESAQLALNRLHQGLQPALAQVAAAAELRREEHQRALRDARGQQRLALAA